MLSKLQIQNYAIIENLEIAFDGNLNIITGETGAGKSILIGALNLVLGERADSSVLHANNKKCIVEGFFKVEKNRQVKDFLVVNDLDADDEIVLRREVSANGGALDTRRAPILLLSARLRWRRSCGRRVI